ncbi:hypothetical protein ACG83_10625 [Frankia sp. R43]|uniref:hypothetical protein n=1 Tax=Frankia sp. R43 TaxID=269536 RepID=UPI0006CA35EE|nr:hypothetical protein [Frankia sp. R43]KPM55726.1 hypothetical protein ACG83_10625 [Frankia sp. R43]
MIDNSYLTDMPRWPQEVSEWQNCATPNLESGSLAEGDRVRPADDRMSPDHEGGEIEERLVLRGVWHGRVKWDSGQKDDVPLYALNVDRVRVRGAVPREDSEGASC